MFNNIWWNDNVCSDFVVVLIFPTDYTKKKLDLWAKKGKMQTITNKQVIIVSFVWNKKYLLWWVEEPNRPQNDYFFAQLFPRTTLFLFQAKIEFQKCFEGKNLPSSVFDKYTQVEGSDKVRGYIFTPSTKIAMKGTFCPSLSSKMDLNLHWIFTIMVHCR